MGFFERYLSIWVALCMGAGILLGSFAPGIAAALRDIEIGEGSQINLPIAILLWLMITPMMMRVDFESVRDVRKKPKGLLITLFVNWLVKPFSMALISYLFFRYVFACGSLPPRRISTSRAPSSLRRRPARPWFSCGATWPTATLPIRSCRSR